MRFATPEYREVALAKIVAPGDVKRRQKEEHVKLLAASIRELGDKPQNAIVVRKVRGGWEIIEGRDRFSALLLNGARKTWLHVVAEATDLELLKCEIHENLHRRHDDKSALTKALVDRAEALVLRHASPKSSPHRPESSRGEARRIVAEAEGTSKLVVAKRDLRARAREDGAADSRATARAAAAPSPLPPIETWGAPLSDEVRTVVVAQQAAFREVDRLARAAQAALTKLREVCPIGGAEQRLTDAAHQLGALARSLIPTHLCPCCKGIKCELTCKLCKDRGFARAEQMADVPPELLTPEVMESIEAAGLDAAPREPSEAELLDALMGSMPDSPEKHETQAKIHEAQGEGNPCGCYSCNYVRRLRGVPEVHPGAAHKSKAKAARKPRIVMPDGHEVTDDEGAALLADAPRELTVEFEDDDAWTP